MSKRALIVGAGLGGLSAAHALAQVGWKIQIFEKAPALSDIGAGIQLSPNATRVLRHIGLLDRVQAAAFEPRAATLREGMGGHVLMYAPLKGLCSRLYGAPYLHIHRPNLHAILAHGLEINLGQDAHSHTGHGLNLSTGQHICGDLIVGADGLRSRLQTQINGPQSPRFTGQVAWRGMVEATPDLQRLIPPDATVWVGQGQHMVTYYLRADLINFVGVTEQETWREEGWNLPGDVAKLRAIFAQWAPAIQGLLEACQSVRRWALFDRRPLPRWTDRAVALLGDAAHPTLPFLAQGAALAMEDAAALAKFAPDLHAYEQARKPRTSALQARARSNAALYHQARWIDRAKLKIAPMALRGPQAHALFWHIFNGGRF